MLSLLWGRRELSFASWKLIFAKVVPKQEGGSIL